MNVVVTGMGGICATGASISEMEAAFEHDCRAPGRSPFASHGVDVPAFAAGDVETAEGESRTVALARHAAREALASAGLRVASEGGNVNRAGQETGAPGDTTAGQETGAPGRRIGVCIGTTVASQLNDIPFYENLRRTGVVDRAAVARYRAGNVAEALSLALGAQGPRLTVCNACSSGADALGVARSWLRSNRCDIVIAGGADELSRLAVCGFHALGVYSTERCRPFDRDRRGLNLGEGAGILILETAEHAAARGATPLCELAGYGAANDAHHLTAPHPDGAGLKRALAVALSDAKAEPSDVAFVNAHGTATPDNDRIEGKALTEFFGRIPVVSTKGWTGHTLGAAGALEAIFTILGLRARRIPGTAGLETPDADIPASVSTLPQIVRGDIAVSTSLAFGGCNAALAFRRCV